jgi:ribose 5-phosphate isomerase A
VNFGPIANPKDLDVQLQCIPGVIETGLFVGLANGAYFGLQNGYILGVDV